MAVMLKHKILLGLTTTPGSDWKEKVKECEKFSIQEIALFPTSLDFEKRKELYALLENSPVKSIPHVHLRTDMEIEELDYLANKFGTQIFNIHPRKNIHSFAVDFGKYAPLIYIENVGEVPEAEELDEFGGLCVDFSHWQDEILKNNSKYVSEMEGAVKKYRIGCSHISGVVSTLGNIRDTKFSEVIYETYGRHTVKDLNEINYIKNFIKYLPDIISIELENSFEEQLKVKEYLEKIIKEKV